MRRIPSIICSIVAIAGAFVTAEETLSGWRGDGTGVLPDARPPLT